MNNQNFPNQFGQDGPLDDFFDMFQMPTGQQFGAGGPPFGPPGQGPSGGPPFGPPSQGPGGGPPFGPPSQGPGGGPPFGPGDFGQFDGQFGAGGPAVQAVDPGSFYGCLRRMTRVRLTNGRRFWFYPTFIGRTSVAGYRWYPRTRQWRYTGFDTNSVASFQCF